MAYDYSWLDRPTLTRFKAVYEKAKQEGQEQFTFEVQAGQSHPFLLSFAKYLIEWRESVLSPEQQGSGHWPGPGVGR